MGGVVDIELHLESNISIFPVAVRAFEISTN